jgi:3-oxoacyl-[acyl-carrier-protein] synthase II
MLVLESTTSAERRRVQPLARVVGYGASMDAIGLADPDSQGKAHAMIAALKDAKLEPSNITYVNAHGTSTIANDREESRALRQVFRERADRLVVNSTKSMIGHTLAASGAIEAVACVKSLLQQRVHPTRNFHVGDADCTLDYAGGGMRDLEFDYCMSNSSGIGGFNATLIFGRA